MTDDDLIALAKKATPGPWEATDGVVWIDTREQVCCGRSYTECCGQYDIKGGQEKIADSGETDAAYIAAANPAAIIALIERRRAEVGKMWSASEEHRRDARHWEEKADTLSRNLAAEQRESSKLRAEVERLTRERDEARQEAERLSGLINTPRVDDFLKAVRTEAAHQIERWGAAHDEGKTDADWFWLIGYLAGKALNKPDKKLHHIITTAAACLNWHGHATGAQTTMRPGISPSERGINDAA